MIMITGPANNNNNIKSKDEGSEVPERVSAGKHPPGGSQSGPSQRLQPSFGPPPAARGLRRLISTDFQGLWRECRNANAMVSRPEKDFPEAVVVIWRAEHIVFASQHPFLGTAEVNDNRPSWTSAFSQIFCTILGCLQRESHTEARREPQTCVHVILCCIIL